MRGWYGDVVGNKIVFRRDPSYMTVFPRYASGGVHWRGIIYYRQAWICFGRRAWVGADGRPEWRATLRLKLWW